MRRVGLGGVTAALFVGLGLSVATTRGADNDGNTPVGKGLLSGLFHEKTKPPAKQANKASEEAPPPVQPIESAAAQQQRHMNAWFRRVEVCDRLRMIAEQTGNESLRDQANELEERATAIYRQQTSGLPLAAQAVPTTVGREPSAERKASQSAEKGPTPLPANRSSNNSTAQSTDTASRLGRGFDQREQAILNGTGMGGN